MLILEWAKCVSCLSNCFKAKVGENKDGCGQATNTFVSQVAVSSRVACAAFKVKLHDPLDLCYLLRWWAAWHAGKTNLLGDLQTAASLGYILVHYLVGLMAWDGDRVSGFSWETSFLLDRPTGFSWCVLKCHIVKRRLVIFVFSHDPTLGSMCIYQVLAQIDVVFFAESLPLVNVNSFFFGIVFLWHVSFCCVYVGVVPMLFNLHKTCACHCSQL